MRLCRRASCLREGPASQGPRRIERGLGRIRCGNGIGREGARPRGGRGGNGQPAKPGESFHIGPRLAESRSVEMDQRLTGQALLR